MPIEYKIPRVYRIELAVFTFLNIGCRSKDPKMHTANVDFMLICFTLNEEKKQDQEMSIFSTREKRDQSNI